MGAITEHACGLCLAPAPRDFRVRVTTSGNVSFDCRLCESCLDEIDAVRKRGLDAVRARDA